MVLALGRVLRSEPLTADDVRVLTQARDLFETMTSQDVLVFGPRASRMLDDGSYFDALQVVELQTSGIALEERLNRYAEVLRKLADGVNPVEADHEVIAALRALFSTVGEKTLARAYEASRAPEDVTWLSTKQAILHS
jgi:hypothetical protein